MKSPCYFECFGSIGRTVSFVGKYKNKKTGEIETGTMSMLLAECPDDMRAVVNADVSFKTHGSYERQGGEYVASECEDKCCKHRNDTLRDSA